MSLASIYTLLKEGTAKVTMTAGALVLGKVAIDQTTPGTTNKVVAELAGSKASEYEALTIDTTAGGVAFTAAKYAGCTKVSARLETAQIRFTIDGTAPTAAVGTLLEVGEILTLDSAEDIAAFRGFRTGTVSGSLRCIYSA